MDLKKIAYEILDLEYDGFDDEYIESCFYVAQDLYGLSEDEARKVTNIIEGEL